MAQAARAYSYPQRERAADVPERPRVRAIPGGRRTAVETVSSTALLAARVIAVALVLLALAGFARIAINTATVTMSMQTQEIDAELSSARSSAATLEVQQSTLSNPSRIRSEASDLGMGAVASTETISLSPDVVVTGDSGQLELAESIRVASNAVF